MDKNTEEEEGDETPTSDHPRGQFWQSPSSVVSTTSSVSSSESASSYFSNSDYSLDSSSTPSSVSNSSPQSSSYSSPGLINSKNYGTKKVQSVEPPNNRRQARLLLVSLLENVCSLYPEEQSKKVFTTLCERLARMGIITSEDFADNFTSVRTLYRRTLKELIYQAQMAVTHPSESLACLSNPFLDASSPPSSLETFLDVRATRYRSDFHEIRRLGKGGFGSVWHVRHKLDGEDYAVKKIRLKLHHQIQKKLREVRVLAGLNHPNVVRYFSAWLEFDEILENELADENSTSSSSSSSVSSSSAIPSSSPSSSSSFSNEHEPLKLLPPIQTSTSISKTDNSSSSQLNPVSSSSSSSSSFVSNIPISSIPNGSTNRKPSLPRLPSDLNKFTPSIPSITKQRSLTLFIQMELCCSTLYDYLLYRNHQYSPHGLQKEMVDECSYIFRSLLLAVAYIHEKGLSHRDITPHNIFLVKKKGSVSNASSMKKKLLLTESESTIVYPLCEWLDTSQLEDIVVKLGDFGLATDFSSSSFPLSISNASISIDALPPSTPSPSSSSPPPKASPPDSTSSSLSSSTSPPKTSSMALVPVHITTGVGTATYSAPEQLQSTSKYDVVPFQADMYSLGVLLFELLHPFGTVMERIHLLQQLRQGYLPPLFIQSYPHHAAMILWLTAENPLHRPTPQELLDMFPKVASPTSNPMAMITHLKCVVESQEQTIQTQALEIEQLKAQLESLQLSKETNQEKQSTPPR